MKFGPQTSENGWRGFTLPQRLRAGQTDRQTYRHADRNTPIVGDVISKYKIII